jgi:tRNA A37 N6-isopentenylltransferase MiaA
MVPILVGGTHQYIEGVLVSNPYLEQNDQDTIIESKNKNHNAENTLTVAELLEIINREPLNIDAIVERAKIESAEHIMQILKEVPRDHLFHLLERVDHVRAVKLHPNDYRKLIRSLYVS